MAYMTVSDIVEYYDSHPNVTLKELSRMSGWTVPRLRGLLMQAPPTKDSVAAYVAEGLGEYD